MKTSCHLGIIRLSAMGDVAITVPLVRALATQHPDIKITYCSKPGFKPLFDDISGVDFFSVDTKENHKGFFGIIKLFFALKNKKITHFVDFHEVLRTKLLRFLFRLSGIKTVYTPKARQEKNALTRPFNKKLHPLTPIIKRHQNTLKSIGFEVILNEDCFQLPTPQAFNFLNNHQRPFIGLAPFAQYPSKVYPFDLTQKLIADLLTCTNATILLFGGGMHEIKLLNTLKTNSRVEVVAGKLSLDEELNLISQLALMISMDSANGHLAAMMRVPVITLWGATHPYLGFIPYNQPLAYSLMPDLNIYPKLPSSVYGKKIPKGYEDCMRSIATERVVDSAISILADK